MGAVGFQGAVGFRVWVLLRFHGPHGGSLSRRAAWDRGRNAVPFSFLCATSSIEASMLHVANACNPFASIGGDSE